MTGSISGDARRFPRTPHSIRPDSIGIRWRKPIAAFWRKARLIPLTLTADITEAPSGLPGELVMRGPQFMLGYWRERRRPAAVLRDGWFGPGDTSPAIARASTAWSTGARR